MTYVHGTVGDTPHHYATGTQPWLMEKTEKEKERTGAQTEGNPKNESGWNRP